MNKLIFKLKELAAAREPSAREARAGWAWFFHRGNDGASLPFQQHHPGWEHLEQRPPSLNFSFVLRKSLGQNTE